MTASPAKLQIFVEGSTDRSLFRKILDHHQVEGVVFYEPKSEDAGGKDWLRTNLGRLLKEGNAERFGLVLDADRDAAAKWQSIAGAMRKIAIPVVDGNDLPATYPANGLVNGNFGVWIVNPSSDLPGDLEGLKLSLAQNDNVLQPAKAAVAREPELLTKTSKAVFGTWLAWQRKGAGMVEAEAWKEGLLQIDGTIANDFVAWVRRLLNSPAE